ncbi:hypothetical protein [Desulfosarcina ovata]|uniref:Uncharacterized protein n=1 Tax=Desulfosarcina ovata subsp. ovata TaxID=2752305 RepID=A0A5K8AKF3_9BACT|nr:hypothetical protein [Desulfosarcina ovata]BBO93207.1 hypothetical protein DSCOOX_63870 [Desulfosarcina ovata subsp. ovata]
MTNKNKEFYLSVISIAIAASAVVLSQFPPIYTYFEKAKIEIGRNPQIHIGHSYGNIGITKQITIKNMGDKSGEIEKIRIFVCLKNKIENGVLFPAKYYLKKEIDSFMMNRAKINISEFFLNPNSSWDETTVFFNEFNHTNQEQYRNIAEKALSERNKWEWNLRHEKNMDDDAIIDYESAHPMKFSDQLSQDIQKYIELRLKWFVKGEYYLVEYITHNGEVTTTYYTFSVSNSTLRALQKISKSHNYFIDEFSDVPKGIIENLSSVSLERETKDRLLSVIKSKDL